MTDVELLKALGLTKKSPLSEQIVQTTHHWMKACEENAELEEKISILLSCKNCSENKGGYICQKEYEDKCLAQKIQYIKELQEENAELEEKNIELLGKLAFTENALNNAKAQIEHMENCKNCANYMISGKCPAFFRTGLCKNWEIKENENI